MKFNEIIGDFITNGIFLKIAHQCENDNFNKVQIDSRLVEPSDIFVCVVGQEADGHDYASKAIESGATLLITERELDYPVTQILTKNTRKAAALLAQRSYGFPAKKMILAGITGTNGKTTSAFVLGHLWQSCGFSTGIIGTLGYYVNSEHFASERTTPDALELAKILDFMVNKGVTHVVMEVSSHAIALERIFGLDFQVAVFTNLTQDHLDFHASMENYAATKFSFLEKVALKSPVIVNVDDYYGELFCANLPKAYSLSSKQGDFLLSDIDYSANGSNFSLKHAAFVGNCFTPLPGTYNIYNAAGALAASLLLNPDKREILVRALSTSQKVEGRLEKVEGRKNVYVDYAHTPDGLEKVLLALKEICQGRLICVFGAGGNRDRQKRPLMGKIAARLADVSIITSDNPRREDLRDIIRQIRQGIPAQANYWILQDRRLAIETAVKIASEEDIVLIAGKGAETYQEINDVRYPFDDREIVGYAQSKELPVPHNKDGEGTVNLAVPVDILMLEELAEAGQIQTAMQVFWQVSTDSRTIDTNSIFFALAGEKHNGHDYLPLLPENNLAIVERSGYEGENRLLCESSLCLYQKLAQKYASLFGAKRIAITGSYGKTTTKEFLGQILPHCLKTFANENNQIGVPRTLFKLNQTHAYAVLELGTNQKGEIAVLSQTVQPHLGIITSIGASHLETLHSPEGVYREKAQLLTSVKNFALVPGDDQFFKHSHYLKVGLEQENDFRITDITANDTVLTFNLNGTVFTIATLIDFYVLNAAFAIVAAKLLGFKDSFIDEKLNKPLLIPRRMEIIEKNGKQLIIDCYNANPASMKAALGFFAGYLPERPHCAILGEMLELGKEAEKYHREIACRYKKIIPPDAWGIGVGELAVHYELPETFSSVDEVLASGILTKIPTDAVVLIKGSHGVKLEKLIGEF